jgi:acetyltransferase-like isoleucine patch superfamily enzyme
MAFKDTIKSNQTLKNVAQWLMQEPHQYRPRWWVRNILNPFIHNVSRHAFIRRDVRLDVFPYKKFVVGDYSIIEDYSLIANACGDFIIGKKVLIGCGAKLTGPITMGDSILLAQNVVMSGLNHDFEDVTKPVVDQGFSVRPIVVEDGVWIGAGAVITAGVRIGKNSVVGAGSVVTKDVPPFTVVVGNPAKIVKQYDFDAKEWLKPIKNEHLAIANGVH